MKEYLPYDVERNDLVVLTRHIIDDGFIPDVIYAVCRGGAFVANTVSEYYKLQNRIKPIFYAAVIARSYTGQDKRTNVTIDGWTYDPIHLRPGDKVMLCDDVFDSGHTINALAKVIVDRGIAREDLKIVVHSYKLKEHSEHKFKPDYYCREWAPDVWINFCHEMAEATTEELLSWYGNDPKVVDAIARRSNTREVQKWAI
jgi:hypoxanthine phosphoribosyltransferase